MPPLLRMHDWCHSKLFNFCLFDWWHKEVSPFIIWLGCCFCVSKTVNQVHYIGFRQSATMDVARFPRNTWLFSRLLQVLLAAPVYNNPWIVIRILRARKSNRSTVISEYGVGCYGRRQMAHKNRSQSDLIIDPLLLQFVILGLSGYPPRALTEDALTKKYGVCKRMPNGFDSVRSRR